MKQTLLLLLIFVGLTVQSQPTEKMEYILRYGFIRGGKVLLQTTDTIFQSKEAIHHYMRARTTGIADKIYKVDDIYESIVDRKTQLPLKSIRNVRERKYRYYNEIIFNNKTDTIISQKSGKMVAPENMVDILSLYFYMRKPGFLEKLEQEGTLTLPVSHDEDIFMMRVNYLGMETIKTILGKKECMIVAPIIRKGKVLQRDDGLKFYITSDGKYLPVFMEFDMKIGAVKCELKKYMVDGIVVQSN
jgi:hypothetical protein